MGQKSFHHHCFFFIIVIKVKLHHICIFSCLYSFIPDYTFLFFRLFFFFVYQFLIKSHFICRLRSLKLTLLQFQTPFSCCLYAFIFNLIFYNIKVINFRSNLFIFASYNYIFPELRARMKGMDID